MSDLPGTERLPPTSSRERLFVGLLLPADLGRRLSAAVADALGGRAAAERAFRLPRAEGLHLTLVFLGDLDAGRRARTEAALARGLAGASAPRLVVGGAGAFPRRGHERVLWLGVREAGSAAGGGERLGELFRRALAACEEAGHDGSEDRARPYRPHVTVARPRSSRPRVPASFFELALEEEHLPGAVELLRSEPGEGPAAYRPVAAFPLLRG